VAEEMFAGLMEVELVAPGGLHYNIWDRIATFRGVDNLLLDLAMRPDFMHQTARRFMEIARSEFRQLEEQELLDPHPILLHCTPACTRELPADDFDGHVRPQDVWGRCAAQIFGVVSPDMREPMDFKIDILRKRFRNLRKISITPWADPQLAAKNIGSDYVLAAKPNPAFVATPQFNPELVEQEIARYCEACKEHGTTLEFVLKDISTIANNPENLTRWAATVKAVIDKYYA
jgi:hypothetical protein